MATLGVPRERLAISPGAVPVDAHLQNLRRATHHLRQLLRRVEVQVVDHPEAIPQRRREQPRPRGRPNKREPLELERQRPCVRPLAGYEVHLEVFHCGVQVLFHGVRQPVYLVNEEHLALAEVGQHSHDVQRLFERRAGRVHHLRSHLAGYDVGERSLAEPGRAVEQDVLQRLAARLGRGDRYAQALHHLQLPHVFAQCAGRRLSGRLSSTSTTGSGGSTSSLSPMMRSLAIYSLAPRSILNTSRSSSCGSPGLETTAAASSTFCWASVLRWPRFTSTLTTSSSTLPRLRVEGTAV